MGMRAGEYGRKFPEKGRQNGKLVDRCRSHEDVDDATGGVRLAEVETAADPRDEVELEDADEAPVETADHDLVLQVDPERVQVDAEVLHRFHHGAQCEGVRLLRLQTRVAACDGRELKAAAGIVGIEGCAHRGAHIFRHSLATELLRSGATLTEIGQLLRHESRDTTRIYAKVDIEALRTLSLPWPGGAQ